MLTSDYNKRERSIRWVGTGWRGEGGMKGL